jgi:hypothetical protein
MGWAVTPRTCTHPVPTSVAKNTHSLVRVTAQPMRKKSTASRVEAWARRNRRHAVSGCRLGAGGLQSFEDPADRGARRGRTGRGRGRRSEDRRPGPLQGVEAGAGRAGEHSGHAQHTPSADGCSSGPSPGRGRVSPCRRRKRRKHSPRSWIWTGTPWPLSCSPARRQRPEPGRQQPLLVAVAAPRRGPRLPDVPRPPPLRHHPHRDRPRRRPHRLRGRAHAPRTTPWG